MARIDADEMINGLKTKVNEEWQGDNQRIAAYLTFVNRFHEYSAFNRLMILAQKPDATLVGSFTTWKGLDRKPEKGTGLKVFRPFMSKFPKRDANGNEITDANGETVMVNYVKGYSIASSTFDVSDTEGAELPRLGCANIENPEATAMFLATMERLASEANINLSYSDIVETARRPRVDEGSDLVMRNDLNDLERGLEIAYGLAFGHMANAKADKLSAESQRWIARASTYATAARFGFDIQEYTAEKLISAPELEDTLDYLLSRAATVSSLIEGKEAGALDSWLDAWAD